MNNDKNKNDSKKQYNKVKSYQEINKKINKNTKLKQMDSTPQPKDFEEIEY